MGKRYSTKTIMIVPIQKPGKDPKNSASYTSHLGKTLETIINERLNYFLEKKNNNKYPSGIQKRQTNNRPSNAHRKRNQNSGSQSETSTSDIAGNQGENVQLHTEFL